MLSIIRISEWTAALEELLAESEQEGFRFVRRAKEDWLSGANRFSQAGEALFGIFAGARCVALGGVNRASESCGRLRRFYVRREARRKGLGRQLVQHVLAFARPYYSHVELRCDTDAADRFYCALGFSRTALPADTTHTIDLQPPPNPPPAPTSGLAPARGPS